VLLSVLAGAGLPVILCLPGLTCVPTPASSLSVCMLWLGCYCGCWAYVFCFIKRNKFSSYSFINALKVRCLYKTCHLGNNTFLSFGSFTFRLSLADQDLLSFEYIKRFPRLDQKLETLKSPTFLCSILSLLTTSCSCFSF
jgi:hypothetical protein